MPPEAAIEAQQRLVAETGIQLFSYLRTSPEPDRCAFEVTVGRQAMAITPAELADCLVQLVAWDKITATT